MNLTRRVSIHFNKTNNQIKTLVNDIMVPALLMPAVYAPRLKAVTKSRNIRTKPLFLVLRYKYCDGNPDYGISNEEHAVSSPLRSSQVADIIEYYFDTDTTGAILKSNYLIDLIAKTKPDLLILSSYNPNSYIVPHPSVLRGIKKFCNIPIAAIWHDSTGSNAQTQCRLMMDYTDLHILLDSGNLQKLFKEHNNFIRLWAPLDFETFYPSKEDKDIDISFLGSVGSYRSYREPILESLSKANLSIHRGGGQRESLMSIEDYANTIRRSKISLNFSGSVGESNQLKVRVLETMFSGSMLMETNNPETCQYFTPMVDYVPFNDAADLIEKSRYYLSHEKERVSIAMNGYKKATETYSHIQFWDIVMSKLSDLSII